MFIKLKTSLPIIILLTVSLVILTGFTRLDDKSNEARGWQVDNFSRTDKNTFSSHLVTELENGSTGLKSFGAKSGIFIDPNSLLQQQMQTMNQRVLVVAQANNAVSDKYKATEYCMDSAKLIPKTGNPVIDTRCSLVAFEVCIYQKTGFISQSQGTKKQCAIIQGLGGATACQQPCIAAADLPVGGNGRVGRYTGLTAAAVSCYNERIDRKDGVDKQRDACNQNLALQCLMNGSSSARVNEDILQERKNGCIVFHRIYGEGCLACSGDKIRVDYDPTKIDLDSEHCTPALAAAKQCIMSSPGAGK